MKAPIARFSTDIAEVVFGEDVDPRRVAEEVRVVARFRQWIQTTDRARMHKLCGEVDRTLIAALSPRSMLEVARVIEERFPEVMANMPRLSAHMKHLERASQLAQVFMPANLAGLARALQEEGTR